MGEPADPVGRAVAAVHIASNLAREDPLAAGERAKRLHIRGMWYAVIVSNPDLRANGDTVGPGSYTVINITVTDR